MWGQWTFTGPTSGRWDDIFDAERGEKAENVNDFGAAA